MKNRFFAVTIVLGIFQILISPVLRAQNVTGEPNVLFTVNGSPTYSDEFLYVFNKNNLLDSTANLKKEIDEYLELFINFKLKVAEAKGMGMDTTTGYVNELAKYREQLTKPYLTEKDVTQSLVREAYDRLQYEVDASHILVRVDNSSSPADTMRAYRKITEALNKARAGQNFGDLAVQYSEEPGIAITKGHLGYFTALQMVYPFENAAFNTEVEKVSDPVRTQFGYHIVKVNDRRPTHGKIQVNHIMRRFTPNMTGEDSARVRNRIFEIHELATSGYDWSQLCKENSEDNNTKDMGGVLAPFGVGERVPETLLEAAFLLEDSAEISDPLMTQYGWHILQLNQIIPYRSFEEMESELARKIKRDSRSNKSQTALISRLKMENAFLENIDAKTSVFSAADSTTMTGDWIITPDVNLLENLFSVADTSYSINDFVQYVNEHYKKSGVGHVTVKLQTLYNSLVEEALIEYEKAHLAEKYEDYRFLVNEYEEGILLFDIMEQEVWAKSAKDSTGMLTFFESNLDDYKVKESASIVTFAVESQNDSLVQQLTSFLNSYPLDSTYLRETLKEVVSEEFRPVEIKELDYVNIGSASWEEWMSQGLGVYTTESGGISSVHLINAYKPEGPAEFREVRGIVMSDYQDLLDKNWISALRDKYVVEVNKKELKRLYKEIEN